MPARKRTPGWVSTTIEWLADHLEPVINAHFYYDDPGMLHFRWHAPKPPTDKELP